MSVLETYRRAARYQSLSPAQRAGLRMWSSFWQTALAAGIVAVIWAAATGQQHLSFLVLGQVLLIGVAAAFVSGLVKLVRSQGEPTLAAPGANSMTQRRLPDMHAAQARAASGSTTGRAGFSSPLTARVGSTSSGGSSGHLPPLMPETRRERMDVLRRAATSAATRPIERAVPAISPRQSAVKPPAPPQVDTVVDEPRAAPAPINDADDENGPPTIQLPAINTVTAAKEDSWAR